MSNKTLTLIIGLLSVVLVSIATYYVVELNHKAAGEVSSQSASGLYGH